MTRDLVTIVLVSCLGVMILVRVHQESLMSVVSREFIWEDATNLKKRSEVSMTEKFNQKLYVLGKILRSLPPSVHKKVCMSNQTCTVLFPRRLGHISSKHREP